MIHTYFPASQSCFRFSFSLPLKLTWQGCTLPLTNHLFFGSLWDPTSPRIFSAPFAMPIIKSPDESTLLLRIEVGGFLSLVAKATQRSAALQKGYFAPSVSLIPESDKIHGYPWQERQTWRKSASLELLTPIISIWFNLIWSNLTTFIFFLVQFLYPCQTWVQHRQVEIQSHCRSRFGPRSRRWIPHLDPGRFMWYPLVI